MAASYQVTPFEVGQVKAHLHHQLGPAAIARLVFKPDGKTNYSVTAIHDCIARLEADPEYRGERRQGSGAPRQTTKAQDAQIVHFVFRNRGRRKVTVAMLRKAFVAKVKRAGRAPWVGDKSTFRALYDHV